jgi:hypothetical protein
MATARFDADTEHTRFQDSWLDGAYDEMFRAAGEPRAHYRGLHGLR